MKTKKIDFTPHSNALNEMIFEAKDLKGISAETLYKWRQAGILDDKRDPEARRRWNYFSALDIIWVGILKELKQFRLTTPEIIACKEILFGKIKAEDTKEYPALEYYTFLVLLYNQPLFIVISYNKGIDMIWMLDEKDYFLKLKSGEIENHTLLSLHKAVKTNLEPVYNIPEFCKMEGLTKDELEVISIIRKKEYKTIKVEKKNEEIDFVEGTELTEDVKRIEQLLKSKQYNTIEVKQTGNKNTIAHRLVRKNFKR